MTTSRPRAVHLRAASSTRLRAACGAWVGTALLTRDKDDVTCRRCRGLIHRADLGVEPMRGRMMDVTLYDAEPLRAELVDAVAQGLLLRPPAGETPVLRKWSQIDKAEFVTATDIDDGLDDVSS